MKTVAFSHSYDYLHDSQGATSIALTIRISATTPHFSSSSLDIDASIDTLSPRSVFNGAFGAALGLNLSPLPTITIKSGLQTVRVQLHDLWVTLPSFGSFLLKAAFTVNPITQNFLGRDFLRLIALGIEEGNLEIHLLRKAASS